MPAYNAEATLRTTFEALSKELVDDIILTDDRSRDGTVALSKKLGIDTIEHETNRGYGGNQRPATTPLWRRMPTSS
jgi:glycosyltransferase involved in cell wall biosynthesis